MDASTIHRDYVNAELEYRRGRISSDFARRRVRRAIVRREEAASRTR